MPCNTNSVDYPPSKYVLKSHARLKTEIGARIYSVRTESLLSARRSFGSIAIHRAQKLIGLTDVQAHLSLRRAHMKKEEKKTTKKKTRTIALTDDRYNKLYSICVGRADQGPNWIDMQLAACLFNINLLECLFAFLSESAFDYQKNR